LACPGVERVLLGGKYDLIVGGWGILEVYSLQWKLAP